MSIIVTQLARIRWLLRNLFRRERAEYELAQEITHHLDLLVEQKIAGGMSPREARRAARLEFGDVPHVVEQVSDVWYGARMERTARNLRRCLRSVAGDSVFFGVSVWTLGIGIAAVLTVFTMVNAVLLRPLPFPEADQMVVLKFDMPGLGTGGGRFEGISGPLYFFYSDESSTLDSVTAIQPRDANLTDPQDPQTVRTLLVTVPFFDVLRTEPRIGRGFTRADEQQDAAPVILLSDALWRTRFGADPDVVGRIVDVDGARTEVIGVMPPGFAFLWPDIDLWRPLQLDRESAQLGDIFYLGVARITDGFTLEQTQAELDTKLSDLRTAFPSESAAPVMADAGFRPAVVAAREHVVGDIRTTLWLLLGAVGFLLLIICANVANLFLARSETRRGEAAIRFALGARRAQVAGAVLIESLLLGAAGGAVALPLTLLAVRLLGRFGPSDLPRLGEISVDGAVLLFGAATSILVGCLFGVLPAWRTSAVAESPGLPAGTRRATGGRAESRVRRGLVTAQLALAVVLLIGAGLTARSFQRVLAVDPGFDPVDTLTLSVALPENVYGPTARLTFQREFLDDLRGLPGVVGAAATTAVPLADIPSTSDHSFEHGPLADLDVPPLFRWKRVTPGYFDAMRIGFSEGRDFDRLEAERGDPVAIVSRSLARRAWPGQNPLGQSIQPGGLPATDWYRVVGVVDDVHEIGLHVDPPAMAYYPQAVRQTRDGEPTTNVAWAAVPMRVVLHAPSVTGLVGAVRAVVRQLDPTLPLSDVNTLESVVARARQERVFVMFVIFVAALVALLIGSVGLYGVVSYTVMRRHPEIAIRMAVGAQPSDVIRLVLSEAGRLALVGVALGVGAALALTRQLQTLLYETSPLDPVVFLAVAITLASICMLASWLPLRRATRVDPMAVLRAD